MGLRIPNQMPGTWFVQKHPRKLSCGRLVKLGHQVLGQAQGGFVCDLKRPVQFMLLEELSNVGINIIQRHATRTVYLRAVDPQAAFSWTVPWLVDSPVCAIPRRLKELPDAHPYQQIILKLGRCINANYTAN